MPLVLIRAVAPGVAFIHPLEGPVDPGFGGGGIDHPWLPGMIGGGVRPDQGLPGGGGYPSHGLPGSPGHPDNRPPATRPPQVDQNTTLVLVRDPEGVWHYATLQPGSPPPRPVPVPPPARPDQGLPPHPSQGLPGAPPPTAGTPLPPTAAPKPA